MGRFAWPTRWAEDGRIYFQEGPDLFSVDVKSGEREQITRFASSDQKPRAIEISPDAGKIAYSIKDEGGWKVRVASLDSDKYQEIAKSEAQIVDLVWRPDGNSVLFSGSTGATYQIFEAGLSTADPTQLSNANSDLYLQDVSVDGSSILYSSVNETVRPLASRTLGIRPNRWLPMRWRRNTGQTFRPRREHCISVRSLRRQPIRRLDQRQVADR